MHLGKTGHFSGIRYFVDNDLVLWIGPVSKTLLPRYFARFIGYVPRVQMQESVVLWFALEKDSPNPAWYELPSSVRYFNWFVGANGPLDNLKEIAKALPKNSLFHYIAGKEMVS